MKDLFPGYFPKTGAELEALWKSNDTLFVFDTNILLGLYRYTSATKDAFLTTLDKIKDQVWLPYQIAEEYLRNRAGVIHEEAGSYSTLLKQLDDVKKSLNNQRKNPFIADKTLKQANKLFEQLEKELDEGKKAFTERYHADSILEQISTLFDGKIGQNYTDEQITEVINAGTDRYNRKVPPGFEDQAKLNGAQTDKEKLDALGDYVLWRQIIEYAKDKQKNVVLVTDDVKQDWWSKTKNIDRNFGPRSELILEFRAAVPEHDVYICQSTKFLQLAKEYLDTKIEDDVILEVESTSGINFQEGKTIELNPYFYAFDSQEQQVLRADFEDELDSDILVDSIKSNIFSVECEIKGLEIEKKKLFHRINNNDGLSSSRMHYLKSRVEEIDREISIKTNQLKAFKESYDEYTEKKYFEWMRTKTN
ncbi:PIN domain-containing protein [Celerinatantimonas sp. YJH-8]|uniref:PIN domain-containing protein n=1 Tax=Celerinatantimonas sp. YJH-8 TaxID=3228714 RepID=UPI0038C92940